MTNALSWIVVLFAVAAFPRGSIAEERPNIVVIVSDDHRADVLGCAGHPVVRTPTLDRLATKSIRYSNAFVTTSICAASRASILTGMVERTHGFTFGTPPLARAFCDASYPARLRDAGYHTGFVGKFGIGVEGGRATIDEMFDSFHPLTRTPYRKTLPDGTERHVTDLTGDAALEFMREAPDDSPFCLSVSFNAGHAEDGDLDDHYPPPADEMNLYADTPMPRPRLDDLAIFDAHPTFLRESLNRVRYHWRWDTPEKYDRNMRDYLRMLSGLDRNVGRILEELERLDHADDTVVIFLGDNGYYMGERGFAGKWSHFDESLRVPLIVHDPRDPARAIDERLALNIDVARTILDLAGLGWMEATQGHDLLDPTWTRPDFYAEHRMKHDRIPRWEGIRSTDWMYARYLDVEDGEFLHDLRADPDQLVNLAPDESHRDQLLAMRAETARRSEHAARRGAPLPRVLLLGDSISMGYHDDVVRALEGEAHVVRPAENCAGTTKGLRKIDEWIALDTGDWDVIHVNFGLHDLKRVEHDGRNSNDPADGRQAELEDYERNLAAIADRLLDTGATVVFATTTPVPEGGVRPHRDPIDPVRYNEAAARIMKARGIEINDLHAFVSPHLDDLQKPVDVHFTRAGSRALATRVARAVRDAIDR